MTRLISCLLTSIPLLIAGRLHAEEAAPADQTHAEVLFDEGRRALESEDYATACAKFEESQRIDPGAGTLMNLGTCEERLGNDATALAHFREALAMLAPGDDRIEYAEARVAELEAKLVVAEAGQEPETEPAVPAKAQHDRAPANEPKPPLLGWTLVGVGALGVATGITTSILVAREKDLVDQHCQGKLCDPTGFEAAERGQTLVWVNAAAYGVGAIALGTGIGLVLSHDAAEKTATSVRAKVGPQSAMLNYGGRF